METRIKTAFVMVLVEATLLVLFGVCVKFDVAVHPKTVRMAFDEEDRVFDKYYPSKSPHLYVHCFLIEEKLK